MANWKAQNNKIKKALEETQKILLLKEYKTIIVFINNKHEEQQKLLDIKADLTNTDYILIRLYTND